MIPERERTNAFTWRNAVLLGFASFMRFRQWRVWKVVA